MNWDPETSPDDLRRALASLDDAAVERLLAGLHRHLRGIDHPLSESDARHVLRLLRRRRRFGELRKLGDALISTGSDGPLVQQEYAQSLLDLGELAAADAFLERMRDQADRRANSAALPEERELAVRAGAEARGLLGRRFKQGYVNTVGASLERRSLLERAIDCYSRVYEEKPGGPHRRWHGINSVALALRGQRDGWRLELTFEPAKRAKALLEGVKQSQDDAATIQIWDCAIAMEACLALDDTPGALRWVKRYVAGNEGVDAFEVSSTLRQLIEVWGLNHGSEPGSRLLPYLEARLLSLHGGSISYDQLPPDTHDIETEQNHKEHSGSFMHVQSYLRGLKRASAVARIGSDGHPGLGTGFLVRGGDLRPAWGDELVVVSNSHVMAGQKGSGSTFLRPEHARVTFHHSTQRDAPLWSTSGVESLWESHIDDLDACVVRLKQQPTGISPIPLATEAPAKGDRIFIIGHPRGAGLSFSLSDNLLVDVNEDFVHHRLATAPGSSGSPVFDEQWRLIGLHHAWHKQLLRLDNVGYHTAGEAVRLSAICAAIRQSPLA